jgi:hypothetical protein
MQANFSFLVTDRASRRGIVGGWFVPAVGASFPMADGLDRLMVEGGVSTIAGDPAIVSVELENGWTVTKFSPKALPYSEVRRFNKSRVS